MKKKRQKFCNFSHLWEKREERICHSVRAIGQEVKELPISTLLLVSLRGRGGGVFNTRIRRKGKKRKGGGANPFQVQKKWGGKGGVTWHTVKKEEKGNFRCPQGPLEKKRKG